MQFTAQLAMSDNVLPFPDQQVAAAVLTVIPCYNEEDHLQKLIESLVAGGETLPMRIVIVDGASSDRTPQIARALAETYANVFYLNNPNRVQSVAVNLAVAAYGGEAKFLIRLDAHADYPDDYCQELIREAEDMQAASVVVSMNSVGGGWFQRAVAAAQNSKLGNGGSAHRCVGKDGQWVDHGHHALMRLESFRAVGGYDETFAHNEDAELDVRLRRKNFPIWLTGKTALNYYPRTSPKALFVQYVQYGYGRASNIIKHRSLPKIRQLVPAAVLPAIVLAAAAPLSSLALMPLVCWLAICLGYGCWLAVKSGDLRIAAAGPAFIIMHLGWSMGFWAALARRSFGKS